MLGSMASLGERVSAAGIAVCVASQGKLSTTQLTLGLTGLRDLLPAAALFSAKAVPRGKPPTRSTAINARTAASARARLSRRQATPSGLRQPGTFP
jgi:beta-phosphoglucomutase-like phosphatase (HAD superfamily)